LRWLSIVLALAAAAISLTPAQAQTAPGDVAHDAAQALDRATSAGGPGAAVLISQGGRTIVRSARGMADIELLAPLSPDNVFRMASVTKTFTAAMVLKLAEQGRLSLDDPLARYVPDIPNGEQITLRQLLNHTAGVSDVVRDVQPGFSKRDVDTQALVAEIRKRPPDFAPGSAFAYSNAGYILLGAVIEKVTGQPWHATIKQQILDPLGLRHTAFGAVEPIVPGRAAGYTTDTPDRQPRNAAYMSLYGPAAAGGLISTVDDLALWIRALASGKVVDRESVLQMTSPTGAAQGYGLGLYLWNVRGLQMIGHTGQIPGFASAVGYIPRRDITIVVLANDDHFDARTMARRLAAIALGQPYPDGSAKPMSPEEMQELAGRYRVDAATTLTLSVKDGQLYAQRGQRHAVPLQMDASGLLRFMPDEITYFRPRRDPEGRVARLDYFRDGEDPPQSYPRDP
jgi:CubicO group peptidase (beta-lactamase class C family)